ncbi:MAG: hypothetical protein AB7G93_13315 [Bdellovibrionales bacterium]
MDQKKQNDNMLALAILPLVFGVAWFFSLNGDLDTRFWQLKSYLESKGTVLYAVAALNAVIVGAVVWMCMIVFGLGSFGRKIKQYRAAKAGDKSPLLDVLVVGVGGAAGFLWAHIFDPYKILWPVPKVIPSGQIFAIFMILKLNIAFAASAVAVTLLYVANSIRNFVTDGMPPQPLQKNMLVLGSKLVNGREDWIVIGTNALCSGIMVTAATGGGKSRSCLIPWAKQIMTKFEPFPSICVIDPKNSFARAVLELAASLKMDSKVVHFTLDGPFKTNPIYRPHMLKDSGYMYVAGMIKAATVNFMGKEEGDQKFWGSKGATLIKNLLVFCVAKFGDYFTLRDFYQEMIEVGERDFSAEIHSAIQNGKYDWEEKRNLEIASDYFEREFVSLDQKLKDSIAQTASSFLSQIREARIERVFCPSKDEVSFWGFDEIVDEGKIFVFGIDVPGLAGPISVLMKLMYQRSVMDRIINKKRLESKRLAVSIYDEYQSFVSLGGGQIEGDDDFAAKRREALGATIAATQSHSSLLQATGDEVGTDVLIMNFRTRIVGNTTDIRTINHYKEIGGEIEQEYETQSYTESGQSPTKWPMGKGLVTSHPTVSQSLNKNVHRKPRINGEVLSRLKTFEAIGLVYNGVDSELIEKICLKPSFFPSIRISHKRVIEFARKAAVACLCLVSMRAFAFPSVCSVVKSAAFNLCMEHTRAGCTCGFPPHPCTLHSYYVPQTYIEVTTLPRVSFFKDLPGAAMQLANNKESLTASGSVEMDGHFYHARVVQVPFVDLAYAGMPCQQNYSDKMCFEAMSEHIGPQWKSGSGDANQPLLKIWAANVSACFIKGAASAATTGRIHKGVAVSSPVCSFPMDGLKVFPPVTSEICGGWGVLLPRTGFVESNSTIGAALLVAQRIRSIANEVYQSSAIHPDEKWQMIHPQTSTCFREGQTLGLLENYNGVNERGRFLSLDHNSFLFVVWKRVSCCNEMTSIGSAEFAKGAMKSICQGLQ